MKIKIGDVSAEKWFETMFTRHDPGFFKDLFKLTYSSFTNYLEECAKCAEKFAKTGKSGKNKGE